MIIDSKWLEQAVANVAKGFANKLVKGNTTVYKCGTIIRIDIKADKSYRFDEVDDYPFDDFMDTSMMP